MANPAITVLVDPDSGGIVVTGDTPEYRRTLDVTIEDSGIASAAACRVRLLYRNGVVCVGEEWSLDEYGVLTGEIVLNTAQLTNAFAGRSSRAVIPLTMEIIDVTTNAVVASGQVSCKNNPVVAGTVVIVQEHAEQHAAGADDAITPSSIGAQAAMTTASAAEMIAGTAEGLRAMSPSLVSSAIAAQAAPLSHATANNNPHSVTPAQIGAATAAQGAKADTAVQPAALGTAAAQDVGAFATAAQGLLADTAVQPAALGTAAVEDASAFEPAGAVSSHDGDAGAHADKIAAAIAAAGLGTGDVSGPASSTDGGLVAFSGITGKILKAGPAIGTTAGTVAAGDDARFTNARNPTAHASTHASGQADALTPAAIGAEAAGAVTTHNGAAAAHPFSAVDKYRYGGTDGATTEGTITAAGRALVAGENAAAQRGTLDAYRDQTPTTAANVTGAAVAPDFAAALTLQWTLTGNVTSLATATNLADGETGEIIATIGAYALPADPPSGTYKGAWAVTGTRVRIIIEQIGAAQYWTADSLEAVA